MPRSILILCFYILVLAAKGQTDTVLQTFHLKALIVEAPKIKKPILETPNSVYSIPTISSEQQVQNSLQEYFMAFPALFSMNANNKAQDLRISIRGFGSRAAFGVRGVKIIVDGIPETTTDGQGQTDNINLGIIQKIEVLNNGSASLYGNASGGVVSIQTYDESILPEASSMLNIGSWWQSFAGRQHQLTFGGKIDRTSIILHANHLNVEGYRQHAQSESSNMNIRVIHEPTDKSKVEAIFNYMDSPTANDPGGVDKEFMENDPRAARPQNIQYHAGESIDQFKSSLRYEGSLGDFVSFETYGFFSRRNFHGRLPFANAGIINLGRSFWGHGSHIQRNKSSKNKQWDWQLGYGVSTQRDDRQRFDNMEGTKGTLALNQDEKFVNIGMYLIHDFTLQRWVFTISTRYDINKININDKYLNNGTNGSGHIGLNDLNYSMGIAYRPNPSHTLFFNHATSFETPTLNELSNNPDGQGFNPFLKPQNADHYESGLKGGFRNLFYQLVVFKVVSNNELLPYETETQPGRTFYRNIGKTDRQGIELMLDHRLTKRLKIISASSLNKFTFKAYELDGQALEGKKLPGIPSLQSKLMIDWEITKSLKANLQNRFYGIIYADNANSEKQRSKLISNASLSHQMTVGALRISVYIGVTNISKTKYADNIRINAFGGSYYEAAPDRLFYGGARVGF